MIIIILSITTSIVFITAVAVAVSRQSRELETVTIPGDPHEFEDV